MKKLNEILSFIITGIFIVGGLILAIVVVCAISSASSYSTGLDFLDPFITLLIIIGAAIIGMLAVSAITSGIIALLLIRTADKKLQGDENKGKRILLKCIAYGILIITVIRFAKFLT